MGLFARRALAEREALAVQMIESALLNRVGAHRIAVICPKGGVGKTTVSAAVAHLLSELRGEIVAAVDGNLTKGTLRKRLVRADRPAPEPLMDLAARAVRGQAYPEWTWLAPWHDLVARLRIFSNDGVPASQAEAMPGHDYASVVGLLSRAAQIVVQDMGTSMSTPVARAALETADTLVIATDRTRDCLEATIETITEYAESPRYRELVTGAVVVVNPSRDEGRDTADVGDLLDWLVQLTGGLVVPVPRDPHLATGDLIDWDAVRRETRMAYLRITAHVAARFSLYPLSLRYAPADLITMPPVSTPAPIEVGRREVGRCPDTTALSQ